MNDQLKEGLQKLAFERTTPFCYHCYKDAPTGRCLTCGSDDLMRHMKGIGVEYGTDWVIQEIIRSELEPVDLDEEFENSIRECYPEQIQVGWMTLDTVSVMKEMDPTSWRIAQGEWEDNEVNEGNLIEFSGSFYRVSEVEALT